ncbi:3-ketoacyl-CoA thiolase, mitochondrial [Coelomomyces lativittatus]|nr:3-ketoacyl-CoA thiolase, mitochondrial [Coelomomyces lativittatus]
MSQSPYALRHVRFGEGVKYGQDLVMEDTLASALVDRFPEPVSMGMTAENLAEQYQVSREDCDAYALLSQQRWQKAHQQNLFQSELVPIPLPSRPRAKKGPPSDPTPASSSSSSSSSLLFSVDEHPKPTTTLEGLAKLPPVFKKQGTVTAGNASGISDGAAALLVGTEQALQAHPEFTPLARMVGWSVVGVHPSKMGIGPVPAIRQVLKKVGLTLSQMDLIEINEAFAAQYLAVEKELQLNRDLTNPHGGAIALGHPLAASGARIVAHLAHQLHASSSKMQYALGAACIGGGQGIAVVLEKV